MKPLIPLIAGCLIAGLTGCSSVTTTLYPDITGPTQLTARLGEAIPGSPASARSAVYLPDGSLAVLTDAGMATLAPTQPGLAPATPTPRWSVPGVEVSGIQGAKSWMLGNHQKSLLLAAGNSYGALTDPLHGPTASNYSGVRTGPGGAMSPVTGMCSLGSLTITVDGSPELVIRDGSPLGPVSARVMVTDEVPAQTAGSASAQPADRAALPANPNGARAMIAGLAGMACLTPDEATAVGFVPLETGKDNAASPGVVLIALDSELATVYATTGAPSGKRPAPVIAVDVGTGMVVGRMGIDNPGGQAPELRQFSVAPDGDSGVVVTADGQVRRWSMSTDR